MAKVLILEGHRMAGKSTIAKYLRNSINYSTLINPTGFPNKGQRGLAKIADYYAGWTELIEKFKDEDIIFIFDRYMMSEMVYSRLYKDYEFDIYFDLLLKRLTEAADVEVVFLELTDRDELERRSTRDKALFAEVKDEVDEIEKQRDGYRKLKEEMKAKKVPNLTISSMQVNGKSSKEIAKEISNTFPTT